MLRKSGSAAFYVSWFKGGRAVITETVKHVQADPSQSQETGLVTNVVISENKRQRLKRACVS
jgi:hypothetical protein